MDKREYKNILIIRLSALGDVAMTLPVVYSVAEAYPAKTFTVLTRPFFARLFSNKPWNLEVLAWDFKSGGVPIMNILSLMRLLAGKHFDCVADLHNVLRSWIIDCFFMARGKKVVMVDKMRNKRAALTSKHSMTSHPKMTDRYLEVFARMGLISALTFKSIFPKGSPFLPFTVPVPSVGIAPFARYSNKTYPIDKMEKVVSMLSSENINVFLFGSKGKEADIMRHWQERYSHCTSLAGIYDLETELSVMNSLKVMVAMDSANQHLAAISGVRVITIWGATTPACGFIGYGQQINDSICSGISCQPCSIAGSDNCKKGSMACLNDISPEEVVLVIENIIYNHN